MSVNTIDNFLKVSFFTFIVLCYITNRNIHYRDELKYSMIKFQRSDKKWWRKPLVLEKNKSLPAELAVLHWSLKEDEQGVWLNSRTTTTGVKDLLEINPGKFKTIRLSLPACVKECLSSFYNLPNVSKGVFDLVIWRSSDCRIRFIEVKCPHWDRLTAEQLQFAKLANKQGIATDVVEWEFEDS